MTVFVSVLARAIPEKFECISKAPLLPVKKDKLSYMILHDFI